MRSYIKIYLLLISFVFITCEGAKEVEEDSQLEHSLEQIIHNIKEGDTEILEVEGCEYIIYKEAVGNNHGYGYMAHKGNCKNPIHCYNLEDKQ